MVSFSVPSAPLVEDLDLVLAAAFLFEQLAHVLDGDDGRVLVGVVDVGQAEFSGLGREARAGQQRRRWRGGDSWWEVSFRGCGG
jgi:hypothetical protein